MCNRFFETDSIFYNYFECLLVQINKKGKNDVVNIEVLLGSYYSYLSYYTYCSDFWRIVLFIFITTLPFLLQVLFSKTKHVRFISTGFIIGTYQYVISFHTNFQYFGTYCAVKMCILCIELKRDGSLQDLHKITFKQIFQHFI